MDTPLQQNICRTLQCCRTMLKYCFVFHRGTRASRGHQDHLSMLTHQKTFTSKESRWRFFIFSCGSAQSLNFCKAGTQSFFVVGFYVFCLFFLDLPWFPSSGRNSAAFIFAVWFFYLGVLILMLDLLNPTGSNLKFRCCSNFGVMCHLFCFCSPGSSRR